MTTMNHSEPRHTDVLPDFMTKKQVAILLQVSQRQVEILTKTKRIPQAIYLGSSSPRWNRVELLASLTAKKASN